MSSEQAMTMPEAQAVVSVIKGMPKSVISEQTGLSVHKINRLMQREDARQLVVGALEKAGFTVDKLAGKMVEMLDARKHIKNANGEIEIVDDNPTRLGVLRELNSILGLYAPKEIDIRGTVASASVEELDRKAQDAIDGLSDECASSNGADGID